MWQAFFRQPPLWHARTTRVVALNWLCHFVLNYSSIKFISDIFLWPCLSFYKRVISKNSFHEQMQKLINRPTCTSILCKNIGPGNINFAACYLSSPITLSMIICKKRIIKWCLPWLQYRFVIKQTSRHTPFRIKKAYDESR